MTTFATVIVHWPGQDTPACPDHHEKLVGLAAVLGFQVSWTPAPEGFLCTNCENEAKKLATSMQASGPEPGSPSPEERST